MIQYYQSRALGKQAKIFVLFCSHFSIQVLDILQSASQILSTDFLKHIRLTSYSAGFLF